MSIHQGDSTKIASDAIVDAVTAYLVARHAENPGACRFLNRLRQGVDDVSAPHELPRHGAALTSALTEISSSSDPLLANVGRAISHASDKLNWQVDDGNYYASGAEVSESYRDGNMNATLVRGNDFVAGLFLLVPDVEYLDHRHQAPEFYLNLTGPTAWRFDHGEWESLAPGSALWNEPGAIHATRTDSRPWLSFWAWLGDIDQLCEVLPQR